MQNRVRFGILALPASGLVGIFSVLPPGVFINPAVDPAGFAQASSTVGLGNMIGIVSLVLLLVGVQSLYSTLVDGSASRWAFAGMILTIVGVGLFLPFVGIFAFVVPVAGRAYLNGDTNAIKVIADSVAVSNPYAFLVAGLAELFSVIGSILFGIAIWQSQRVPKWSGILYFLAILLSFLSAPLFSFILGFLGGVLLLTSGGWIAAIILGSKIHTTSAA
jgi:hypothetical protein